MDVVALPFGLIGFTFGLIAFTNASANSARLKKLEERLVKAGVIKDAPDDGPA